MEHIRIQKIEGRDRRIFKCDCGIEIFFVKSGAHFVKYTLDNQKHNCTFVMKFDKSCFDCNADIKIYRNRGVWMKENKDGTEHICEKKVPEYEDDDEYEDRRDWVLVNEWSEECDDDEEECDIDNLHEYKLPDGTHRIERNHTW